LGLLLLSISLACLFVQGRKIIGFIPFISKKSIKSETENQASLSIYVSNVRVVNERYDLLAQSVAKNNPDLLVLSETDRDWDSANTEAFRAEFPYSFKDIRDSGHGLSVRSKFRLSNTEIHHLVSKDRPSLSLDINIDGVGEVKLWVLHPSPPGIQMDNGNLKNSRPRDAELLLLAKKLEGFKPPVIVAGDLNDTGWSRTTLLFKNKSGLRDPRTGRGFFNTYPVKYPFLRFPIDHVFLSSHFSVLRLKTLEDIGSDHLPMLIDVYLESQSLKASGDSKSKDDDVEEMVEEGKKQGRRYERREEEDV
jgi:endonuclease/exonuclease/phosphatase (EEP) superfamily protein YafD